LDRRVGGSGSSGGLADAAAARQPTGLPAVGNGQSGENESLAIRRREEFLVARKHVRCVAILLGACWLLSFAGRAHAARPEKLMRVTIENEGHGVAPLLCLGADVVNPGGHSRQFSEVPKQMTFDCLPGATVFFERKTEDSTSGAIVTLLPEDDGKVVHLRFTKQACYRNGVPCWLEFSDDKKGEDFAKKLEMLKEAKKAEKMACLTVSLNVGAGGASLLPVLQKLKGSGAGLFLETLPDDKSLPDKSFQKLCRAIAEVEPRLLDVDSRGFVALGNGVSKVETLMLGVQPADAAPDLSKLTRLRHLLLVAEKGKGTLDLTPLEKLTQLKALNVVVTERDCRNIKAIGKLANLQFLTMVCRPLGHPSMFRNLRNLRYLIADFSPDVDFSFTERMPELQTFCIGNIEEKHNLKPLEKLPHLRYLALSNGNEKKFEPKHFGNVKEFEKARPDVEVVPYQGICLGSLWLILAVAAAAVAAWLIRRRGRQRLACQR
jgi:hypothetical protein